MATQPTAAEPPWLPLARSVRGFMPDDEGLALHQAARQAAASRLGPLLEVGAYCGKSTVYLGVAAAEGGTVLFSVDHHHGSEENQAGWPHHDPELVEVLSGRLDTLATWRATVAQAGLEQAVVGVVGDSATVAAHWRAPLAMVFLDGGHGAEPAWADYCGWAPLVARGGLLAIHDVFSDPADGGRPPHDIWRAALVSGDFAKESGCGSLRVLRRVAGGCLGP